MAVITRSNHPDALWPGVKVWFGKTYAELPRQWGEIFDMDTSDKAYEYLIETTGFGLAPVKSEGASISYDSDGEGYKTTLTHVVTGLGYIVTREELEDNQYAAVSKTRSKALAFSMRQTQETIHANVLNRAFSTSYPIGDGAALLSASHPTRSGNQSNLIAVAADFSEASLESLVVQIANAQNNRGLRIGLRGEKLIVPTAEMFNAERILKSQLRTGTANNDINAVRSMGVLPGGVAVNNYLTDTDAWFIKTNAPNGMVSYWRRQPGLEQDNDFDTENAKAKSTQRFVAGAGDWRAMYGSAGA